MARSSIPTRVGAAIAALAMTVAFPAAPAGAEPGDWPAFRGPAARGVAAAGGLPDRWSSTEYTPHRPARRPNGPRRAERAFFRPAGGRRRLTGGRGCSRSARRCG